MDLKIKPENSAHKEMVMQEMPKARWIYDNNVCKEYSVKFTLYYTPGGGTHYQSIRAYAKTREQAVMQAYEVLARRKRKQDQLVQSEPFPLRPIYK